MWKRIVHGSGLVGYRSTLLEDLGVAHLFSTRIGPGGEELELVDPGDRTVSALRSAAGALEAAHLIALRQVHGAGVVGVDDDRLPAPGTPGDALVSGRPDRLLMVYSADCVPVLVAGAGGRRVTAIHAGWRGLLAGVIPRAVELLGCEPDAAAIGPCLSLARCEMGPEVVEGFVAAGLEATIDHDLGPRAHIDVRAAARIQLERAGCASIDVSDRCTWRDAAEFPSHRRDVTHGAAPRAGRIGAVIAAHATTRALRSGESPACRSWTM